MAQPFIAQIQIFGFNFAPRDWAFCQGQLVSIAQNTALFSILGTTYGGNGQTNFALPNFQNTSPMNWGQSPGLSNYALGQTSGVSTVTLTPAQMPSHNHLASVAAGNTSADYTLTPTANGFFGDRAAPGHLFATTSDLNFNAGVLSPSGGSLPHQNEQPLLGSNISIALFGVFPSRN